MAYLYTIITIFYVFFVGLFLFSKVNRRNRLRKRLRDSFELLENGLNDDTIREGDIELIYRRLIQPLFSMSLIDYLEKFQIFILKTQSPEFIHKHNETIKKIISDEKSDKPFDGVEEHEKRLLISIEESAKREEVSNIPFTLSELARVLQSKEKSYRSVKRLNNWSIPIAVTGVILTIVFGLRPPQAKITPEDIDRIIEGVKSQIIIVDSINNSQNRISGRK